MTLILKSSADAISWPENGGETDGEISCERQDRVSFRYADADG